MRAPHLTPAAERAIEESFGNNDEAHKLLALIDAEFRTDPMSVQCFDLGVVARVRACVEKRERLKKSGALFLLD